jgi:hypothetical protein
VAHFNFRVGVEEDGHISRLTCEITGSEHSVFNVLTSSKC